MAVKYKLDEDARDQLDRRYSTGSECIAPCMNGGPEDTETAARDAVSNILTRLFGPAGYCVEGGSPSSPGEVVVGPYKVVLDEERGGLARTFLDLAYESWEGDAEDYSATAVTVDNPLLPSGDITTDIDVQHLTDLYVAKFRATREGDRYERGRAAGRMEEYVAQNAIGASTLAEAQAKARDIVGE